MKYTLMFVAGSALGICTLGHAMPQSAENAAPSGQASVVAVNVVRRSVQAINYEHREGPTDVSLAGTSLLPNADGSAKVRSKRGTMEVEAKFDNLQTPNTFGGEYLTYVLWAISPEGTAQNLGEVLVGGNDRSKLTATTNLQAFALIVTAEPYFAVSEPSDVVVLENIVRADTRGTSEAVKAQYELMKRGGYIPTGYKFDPVVLDAKLPLEFLEARNALRIAQSEGAEKYANESYQHAAQLMSTADSEATTKHSSEKELIATSRQAVQTAEEARTIAVKTIREEHLSDERQASANAQAESAQQAREATRQKERAQADAASAQAQMAANQVASAAAVSAAQSAADQSRLIAQQALDSAHRADTDKAAMRAQLAQQLNKILETRDSARGLIISMSDVLFDTGQYSLKPGAREKLAKVAGILIAYPSLNIEVDGYTDNVGGDDSNQKLSENRSTTVRDYLVQQGVATNSVTSKGFGNSSPVASNDDSAGRQQNRRVELVVSGDAIGNTAIATVGN